MAINDDTWFLVRETSGIGDFTGAVGKPASLSQAEIDRIMATTRPPEDDEDAADAIKTSIRHKVGDCLLYTSPSPRDRQKSRMPSSA